MSNTVDVQSTNTNTQDDDIETTTTDDGKTTSTGKGSTTQDPGANANPIEEQNNDGKPTLKAQM